MSKTREDASIVGLFMMAGALVAGGAAGASHLVERANRKRNVQRQREAREAVHEAMQAEIELADLKREAALRGVDVSFIEQECRTAIDGNGSVQHARELIAAVRGSLS